MVNCAIFKNYTDKNEFVKTSCCQNTEMLSNLYIHEITGLIKRKIVKELVKESLHSILTEVYVYAHI